LIPTGTCRCPRCRHTMPLRQCRAATAIVRYMSGAWRREKLGVRRLRTSQHRRCIHSSTSSD
jgi:hypothetical protein